MSEDTVIRHGAPTPGGDENGEPLPLFLLLPQALAEEARAMNRVLVPRGRGWSPCAGRRGGPCCTSSARPPCPGTWPRRRSAACSARRATGTWARGLFGGTPPPPGGRRGLSP